MVLNICNFIQRTEQVPIELDIIAIEEYILLFTTFENSARCLNQYCRVPTLDHQKVQALKNENLMYFYPRTTKYWSIEQK